MFAVLPFVVVGLASGVVVDPARLVRGDFGTIVRNASNINSQQSREVVESGVDNAWVKHLGPSASLEACGRLCAAYDGDAVCRSYTRYADGHPNASLVGACYGHVDRGWLPLSSDFVDAGHLDRPCVDDLDCSLNGACIAPLQGDGNLPGKVCECGGGWAGARCESLDFAPLDRTKALGFDPTEGGANMSSWGGGLLQVNGTWHLWASELANHCGISSYILNSGVVHATSASGGVAGPYVRSSGAFVIPPFAHEPVVARAPSGEVVLVAVAGPLDAKYPSCVCEDGRTTAGCGCGAIPGNECHPQVPTLMYADAPTGPWTTRPLFPDATHGENPSVWIASNGSAFGMSRGGALSAFAVDWRNASAWVHSVAGATGLPTKPDVEDPFIYQDGDDRFHALLHNLEGPHMGADPMLVGVHAFSEDGLHWHFGGLAYTNVVPCADETSLVLNRRERPHLAFAEGDAARRPVALVTSAEVGGAFGDRSFTLVQELA